MFLTAVTLQEVLPLCVLIHEQSVSLAVSFHLTETESAFSCFKRVPLTVVNMYVNTHIAHKYLQYMIIFADFQGM